MPRSLRERLWDVHIGQLQGSMFVSDYDTWFHELARHVAMLML